MLLTSRSWTVFVLTALLATVAAGSATAQVSWSTGAGRPAANTRQDKNNSSQSTLSGKAGMAKADLLAGIAARNGSTFTTKGGWTARPLGLRGLYDAGTVYVTDTRGLTRKYQLTASGELVRGRAHQSFNNGTYREIGEFKPRDRRLSGLKLNLTEPVNGILRLGPVDSKNNTQPVSFQPRGKDGRFGKAVHGKLPVGHLGLRRPVSRGSVSGNRGSIRTVRPGR